MTQEEALNEFLERTLGKCSLGNYKVFYETRFEYKDENGETWTVLISNNTNEEKNGTSLHVTPENDIEIWNVDDTSPCDETHFFQRLWLENYMTYPDM